MTYGRKINATNINFIDKLPSKNLVFTACSNHCINAGNASGAWQTVYNAIDFSKYQLQCHVEPDAPLMFLGRLDRVKGVQNAIDTVKRTGQKLIIAGNIPETTDNLQYYKTHLEPQFDGERIQYIGPVNDAMKNHYLGKAKALLFPIEWDEPFGLVMIEAMACGTPVIGYRRGSVPEVIENNITGFIAENREDMINSISKIESLSREACREAAISRFNVNIIANQYLNLFQSC
jgi:glycosyltransferase involved in cell wall biosynthesis